VLLLAFLHRRIRAVGPLVLAFMVAAVIGSQVAVGLAGQREATLRGVIEVGSVLGLGGVQIFWGLMLAGAAIAGLIGWQLLKWLGRRHLARRSSERLFDALGKRWLRIGNIDMIAGPDLATTAVEPHEFLDFVGGRLSRQFVRDETDLARRFTARALGPDPDGRHRVNEFFCHDDSWRPTMLCLAQAANVVLMDLRGFTPQNHGCRYELQQLLDFVPLEHVVVLIDTDAPRDFIEGTLGTLWQASRADSPNRAAIPARVRLLEDRGETTVARLIDALLEALARPQPGQV